MNALDLGYDIFLFGIIAIASFFSVFTSYLKQRHLREKSVSTARSVAQGGVELRGKAKAGPNGLLKAPFTQKECCFYYAIVTDHSRHGAIIESHRSTEPFTLIDESGECLILPAGAELQGENFEIDYWALGKDRDPSKKYEGSSLRAQLFGRYFYTELRISPHMEIFVEGFCKTEQIKGEIKSQLVIRNIENKLNKRSTDFIISSVDKENLMKSYDDLSKASFLASIGFTCLVICVIYLFITGYL